LSTCPTKLLGDHRDVADRLRRRAAEPPPIGSPFSLLTTSHFTAGMFFGTRPYTSRSNSSLISARRFVHCAAS
jgi:hypothetical protein